MKTVSHATAHLFISDPDGIEDEPTFGQKIGQLFATHPPASDRIRILREMGR
jgi:Zn-dependent protease with chaperone function